jgi:hypothetical protein
MVLADWIILGILLVCVLIGAIVGFGGVLKFFTSGIFGIIISIIVCYFFYGLVYNLQLTQDLLAKFILVLQNADNFFCNLLIKIHIEIVVLVLAMFIIVQILRKIIVSILKHVFEINNGFVRFINKLFGIFLMVALAAMFALIAFQIVSWIGGNTAADFAAKLDGSFLKLDVVFANNPLVKMFEIQKN